MVTRRKTQEQQGVSLDQFDLTAFRKMKEQIVHAANAAIADKIDKIKTLMDEIKQVATDADVDYSFSEIQEHGSDISKDWNSSSAYC